MVIAVNVYMIKSFGKIFFKHPLLSIFLTVVIQFSASADLPIYVGQAYVLAPPGSTIIDANQSDKHAEMVDNAILKILSSPSGKVFCKVITENFDDFRRAFFISADKARLGFDQCKYFFSSTKSIHRVFTKKYYFILTETDGYKADGWTSPRNETFLFFYKNRISESRIIQTLIHEFAISYDLKDQFGFLGIVDSPSIGIKKDANSCTTAEILKDAAVKKALSAIRAFEIEKKISEEINIKLPNGFAQWERSTCLQKLIFMQQYIQPLNQALVLEDVASIFDISTCISHPVQVSSYLEKAKALSQLELTMKDGTKKNACDFFSAGWPYYPGLSFMGGPGPRIGGDGWNKLSTEEAQ